MTGLRAKQKEETRDKVLAAARRLFIERTFDDVGVRDIASAAGVATGTVIAAFGSKGDLLNAIIVEDLQHQQSLIEAEANTQTGFAARVLAMMVACARYQSGQISIVRAGMADSWVRPLEAETKVRAALRPLMDFLVFEIRAACQANEIRSDIDVELFAQMILDIQLATYRLGIYNNTSLDNLKPMLEQRLAILLHGVSIGAQSTQQQPGEAQSGQEANGVSQAA
jgi:AcrR family transcriptional regulator